MTHIQNGADILLDTLQTHWWVDTIFWYPWWASIPLYNSLARSYIRHILTKHEQGAAFMAQWYARSTGRLWVVDATSWPGVANTFTAIADAYKDSIWMLLISGQVATASIGRDAFQELNTESIFSPITKHFIQIREARLIIPETIKALDIALSGRPWPVHIDIPKDIQLTESQWENFIWTWYICQKPEISWKDILAIKAMVSMAKKPIFLIGQWVKLAWWSTELQSLLEQTWIPMVETALAKWIIPMDHDLNIWMLGMHGFYEANMSMSEADLIINIGSRFDDRIVGTYDTFWKNAQVIHVDIDERELWKLVETDLKIHADAKDLLENLLRSFDGKPEKFTAWREQITSWKQERPYEIAADVFWGKQVLRKISRIAKNIPKEVIFWVDVGQHQMWASQILEIQWAENWLFSGGFGTMGFSLPASIWAAVAHPDKKVISISGDGGFQMNLQELGVLIQRHENTLKDLDIKIIILDNEYLGMVKQWQDLFPENTRSEVKMFSPEFDTIASGYGIANYKIENVEQMKKLEKIITQPWPALIWCKIEKEENVFPMVPAGKALDQMVFE